MKIPLVAICQKCTENEITITMNLQDQNFTYLCSKCGYEGEVVLGRGYTVGTKILYKSHHEYSENKDYTMSILLSAIALESDISNLFFKWRELQELSSNDNTSHNIDNDTFDTEYRRLGTISNKIKFVSELMYPNGLDEYVKNSPELAADIEDNYQMLDKDNITNSIKENLYRPRNEIVHNGRSDFNESTAKECFYISDMGIYIFGELDKYKRTHS